MAVEDALTPEDKGAHIILACQAKSKADVSIDAQARQRTTMKERETIVVSGLVTLMLVLWLGFTIHQDPRFAGSLWGVCWESRARCS